MPENEEGTRYEKLASWLVTNNNKGNIKLVHGKNRHLVHDYNYECMSGTKKY